MTLQEWVLHPRSRVERAAWVLLCVALATLVRWLCAPIFGGRMPWMTFAFATLVSTVFGGRGAGMLTAVLGAVAGTALSIETPGSAHPFGWPDQISVIAYLLAAASIVIVGDAVRTAFLDVEAERARLAAVLHVGRVGYWDVDLRSGKGVLSSSPHGGPGHGHLVAPTTITEWRTWVHPEDNTRVRAEWLRALRERTDFRGEYRLRLDDGAMHWVHGTGRFVYAADGTPVRALGAFYETTDLRRADEAERLLSLHADNSPLAIVEWDADYRVIRWSAEAERVFGWTADEVRGKRIDAFPIVYEEDVSAVEAVMRGMNHGTVTRNVSFNRNRRKDGRIIHCAWYNSALHDAAGALLSVYSQVLDRTREVEALDALRASEERFRLATEAMTGLVYEVDRTTGTVRRSRALVDITGFDPADVPPTQQWWLGRVHPDDYARVEAAMERAVVAGARTASAEYRVRHRDGRYVWVWDHAVVGGDAHGRPASQVGCIVSIDERRRMEDALREADRRKDEFLAMLAHELRNPLAPIRNAVHVLRSIGGDADTASRARDMIDRQVSHMARLVDDLLEVSRITRGRIALRTERVALADVVRDAVETTRPIVEQHEHSLSVTLEDDIVLDGDRARLVQVVSNVLGNAAKFTPAGGHVSIVTARVAPDRATIAVRDTGIGVPEPLHDRVFELFAQEDAGLSRSQGGLGIGLTLVRRLIEMHGGDVTLTSRGRNHGTLVTIALPVAPAAAHDAAEGPPYAASGARPRGLRALVVEDNPDARESFEMLLALDGHEVHTAATGVKALRLVDGFRPEVAFIDLGLPDMDGYELARRLRADPRTARARLVAVSGYGRDEDKAACARAGFDVHLTKPVALDVVRDVLAGRGPALPRDSMAREAPA